MAFYTFKRGTVVMVDFSPQVGSEIKGNHFAIVLTKRDRNSNELLTVIPLTSKHHKYHLDLGDEIKKTIFTRLNVANNINYVTENIMLQNEVIMRYTSLKKHTYAKVHQITTISKYRIVKPINQLDPIRKLTVSNEVMDKIEDKIKELFFKVYID
ncbi:MAG: type II toxin-antitoxin system PemK/MazF family toxin [Longicatena sp.]